MAWKNVQYENGKYRTSEGGGGGGSSTFAGLDDVDFSNLQNGQVPKYNSTTQKWENANESGGGGTVTDVKVDGQSVVDPQTGEANITMPTPPTIPVEDVKVNGESVVNAQKVAEIKSYKEVTQAEYNALPDSKLNDGILYAIKDSAGADGFPPLIYSDEEREVGVWRDGKPLYQRTFTATLGAGAQVNLDTNIEFCFLVGNSYIQSNQVVSEQYVGNGVTAYCYVNTTLIDGVWTLRIQNMHNAQMTYCVTVRYTKTTDTAGSGTWTTQGGYAHHYSTTEHVIGTWIDGKPLYEKTISVTFTSSADFSGEIKEGTVDISSFVPTAEQIFVDNGKCYYDVSNSSHRGFYAIICEAENKRLNVFTRYARTNVTGYFVIQYTKTSD